MAKQKQVITDFTSGEISPKMIARTDLESYKHGAKQMRNSYPLPHGACTSRRGTRYVDTVRNSNKPVKLMPFIFSRTLSYIFVLNDGYLRFVSNGSYVKNGSSIYEIPIPYSDSELADVRFTQVGNTMYIVHGNHPVKQIRRLDETNWTLTDVAFTHNAVTDYWYETAFIKFKIISGTNQFKIGDNFTIAAPAGTVTDPAPTNQGNGSIVSISLFTSTTETWTITCVYADAQRQEWTVVGSQSGSSILTWKANDYPKTIVFHEQRLYFGGSPSRPQTIWASAISNYNEFTMGAKDNDAFQFTIASNQYDELVHLVSGRYLIPLTYGGEFSMTGSTTTGITPSTVRIAPQTYHGSNSTLPVKIGNEILFVQRDGKKVRAISYSVAEDVNTAPDISVLAEHITASGLKESTFAQDPDYISWWVRNDGTLLSCVHVRDFNMTGWSLHTTVNGQFENVATIPESNQDTVYMVVKRTINNETKRYIEYFDYQNDIYVDSAKKFTAETAQTVWTGLEHLEGQSVSIVADGFVIPQKTVEAGQITIEKPANSIVIGLGFLPFVELQHPNVNNAYGTSEGGRLSVNRIIAKIQDTIGLKINDQDIPFQRFNTPFGTPLELFTGQKEVKNLGWSSTEYISFEQPYPMPWTLLSVILVVSSYD